MKIEALSREEQLALWRQERQRSKLAMARSSSSVQDENDGSCEGNIRSDSASSSSSSSVNSAGFVMERKKSVSSSSATSSGLAEITSSQANITCRRRSSVVGKSSLETTTSKKLRKPLSSTSASSQEAAAIAGRDSEIKNLKQQLWEEQQTTSRLYQMYTESQAKVNKVVQLESQYIEKSRQMEMQQSSAWMLDLQKQCLISDLERYQNAYKRCRIMLDREEKSCSIARMESKRFAKQVKELRGGRRQSLDRLSLVADTQREEIVKLQSNVVGLRCAAEKCKGEFSQERQRLIRKVLDTEESLRNLQCEHSEQLKAAETWQESMEKEMSQLQTQMQTALQSAAQRIASLKQELEEAKSTSSNEKNTE